jgi:hypothetical protein
MKTTINLHQFRDAFKRMDRTTQFSYEGLEVLFNGLEEYEEDTGEEMDFDVIALCCDFSEMTAEEIQRQYKVEHDVEDESDLQKCVEEFLNQNTWVLGQTESGSFIFRQF